VSGRFNDFDNQFHGQVFIEQDTANGIRKALERTDLTAEDRERLQAALAKLTSDEAPPEPPEDAG
jgi:hypothetical protein